MGDRSGSRAPGGRRALLVAAPLVIAAGLLWMSRVSAEGSYATDILGPIVAAAFGLAFLVGAGIAVGASASALLIPAAPRRRGRLPSAETPSVAGDP